MAVALIHPFMHNEAPFYLDALFYSMAIMSIILILLNRSYLMNRHFIIYENGISNSQNHLLPITDCNNPQEMGKPRFIAWEDVEFYSYLFSFNPTFYVIYKNKIQGNSYNIFSKIEDSQVKILMKIMQEKGITEIFPAEWYYYKKLQRFMRKKWLKSRHELDERLNSEFKKFKYGKVCSVNQWAYEISIYRSTRKEGRKLNVKIYKDMYQRNCLFTFKLVKDLEIELYKHFGKENINLLKKEKYNDGIYYMAAYENTKDGLKFDIRGDLEFKPYWGLVAIHNINDNNREQATVFSRKINPSIPDYSTKLQNIDIPIRGIRPYLWLNINRL